jgi:ABC-type multidrug transport system fused ATPase/permease subunit
MRDQKRVDGSRTGGILLLDEVNSIVDRDTDKAMQEVIKREFTSHTIIIVSHRLAIVREYFDTAVVFGRGRLAETGPRNALVEVEGSRFREFWLSSRYWD